MQIEIYHKCTSLFLKLYHKTLIYFSYPKKIYNIYNTDDWAIIIVPFALFKRDEVEFIIPP